MLAAQRTQGLEAANVPKRTRDSERTETCPLTASKDRSHILQGATPPETVVADDLRTRPGFYEADFKSTLMQVGFRDKWPLRNRGKLD
jgi:hypothetical protein